MASDKNPTPLIYDKQKNNCVYEDESARVDEKKVKSCAVSVIYVDNNGYIQNAKFISHPVPGLGHGEMQKINAIILHRTESNTKESSFSSFESKHEGTHFLIDKNGDIYQTESLFEYTPHIGKIRSRCSDEKSCSKEESEEIKKIGWDVKKIHDHEMEKEYPIRYPCNQDSVGIEVVAKNTSTGWDKPTTEQVAAIKILIETL